MSLGYLNQERKNLQSTKLIKNTNDENMEKKTKIIFLNTKQKNTTYHSQQYNGMNKNKLRTVIRRDNFHISLRWETGTFMPI